MVDLTDALWRKSSRSGSNGGACVEVADLHNTLALRDSKNPRNPALFLSRATFENLTDNLKKP